MKDRLILTTVFISFVLATLVSGCGNGTENPIANFEPSSDEPIPIISWDEVWKAKFGDMSIAQTAPVGTSWLTVCSMASSWLGVPYKWGGNDRNGIDCSHLVYQVYKSSGAEYRNYLTVSGIKQSKFIVEVANPSPGDLLLFRDKFDGFDHVGIYLWDKYFIHASLAAGKVVVDNIDRSPYYPRGFWVNHKPYSARWILGLA